MTSLVLQTIGLLLLAGIAVHAVILHMRLTRFRTAMTEMGLILPTLDASVDRMTHLSAGFARRMESDLRTVEERVAAARRAGSDLAAANRAATDAVLQLELLLRQYRRVDPNRNAPIPREQVEPKGFAERAGLPPAPEGPLPQGSLPREPLRQEPFSVAPISLVQIPFGALTDAQTDTAPAGAGVL